MALARRVPQVFVHSVLWPACHSLYFTSHAPLSGANSTESASIVNTSAMNCLMSDDGIQGAPKRASICSGFRSSGCTASSAFTFAMNSGPAAWAISSFSRTWPDRYSSAGSQSSVSGFRKILPSAFSCSATSFADSFSNPPIRSRLIRPNCCSDMASASVGVSAFVGSLGMLTVRLLNRSALAAVSVSSS